MLHMLSLRLTRPTLTALTQTDVFDVVVSDEEVHFHQSWVAQLRAETRNQHVAGFMVNDQELDVEVLCSFLSGEASADALTVRT